MGEALHRGSVDVLRAKILVNQTKHVPAEEAREVVNRVINSAPRLTTGQLAARIRRLCIEVKSTEAKMRYDRALKERRLVGEATNQEQGI